METLECIIQPVFGGKRCAAIMLSDAEDCKGVSMEEKTGIRSHATLTLIAKPWIMSSWIHLNGLWRSMRCSS